MQTGGSRVGSRVGDGRWHKGTVRQLDSEGWQAYSGRPCSSSAQPSRTCVSSTPCTPPGDIVTSPQDRPRGNREPTAPIDPEEQRDQVSFLPPTNIISPSPLTPDRPLRARHRHKDWRLSDQVAANPTLPQHLQWCRRFVCENLDPQPLCVQWVELLLWSQDVLRQPYASIPRRILRPPPQIG